MLARWDQFEGNFCWGGCVLLRDVEEAGAAALSSSILRVIGFAMAIDSSRRAAGPGTGDPHPGRWKPTNDVAADYIVLEICLAAMRRERACRRRARRRHALAESSRTTRATLGSPGKRAGPMELPLEVGSRRRGLHPRGRLLLLREEARVEAWATGAG